MQTPSAFFRRDDGFGRHRASSDPLSRGGAFGDGNGLLSQEPNPFEQSFGPLASNGAGGGHNASSSGQKPTDGSLTAGGGRRARSTSPSSLMPRMTPGGSQRLPPLALMQSPGGGELAAFGWGDSLRTGPLSPALLNGPAGTSSATGRDDLFGSSIKTGLTPFLAGGAGPAAIHGTSAAAAAAAAQTSGGVSFPPPSPATAALFALMTNNTPGTSDAAALAGGGPRPHEGPNEANSFEASFARANSDNHIATTAGGNAPLTAASKLRNSLLGPAAGGGANGSSGALNPPGMPTRATAPAAVPGVPMHLHSGTQQGGPAGGYYPGPAGSQAQPPQGSYYAQHPHHHGGNAGAGPPPHQPPQQQQHSHPSAAHLSFTAPPPPSNPLDLLSQASFHNDDAVVAAAALSGLATPGGGFPAAAMLAAAQQQQQQQQRQGSSVVPGSTLAGDASNSRSMSPAAAGSSIATGRGKRSAASQQNNDASPSSGGTSAVPAKRARKQTAAAQAAHEEMQYAAQHHDDDDTNTTTATRSKTGAGKRGKRGAAANTRRDTADGWTDGSVSVEGSVPPEFDSIKAEDGYGGFDDDDGHHGGGGGGGGGAGGTGKGGRGRKKDSGETEEEKRKNFLERNRQAALKCRQRKKAWLQSLQTKVELLTTDNDALQNTVNHLREEISSLRAILSAHANCPIAMSNSGVPMQPGPPGSHHPQHPHPHQQQQQQQPYPPQHASHGPPPPGMQQQAGYVRASY
ncbi:hypothetical protein JCM3774_001239 [Rhodotorula dairenensis]